MTKKLLGLLAGALLSISTVYAVPLQCTETNPGNGNPATFNAGGNGTGGTNSTFSGVVFTCVAPTIPLGDTLTSVTVAISDSFSQGISTPPQTNTVDFLYTFSGFSGVNSLTTSSSSNPSSGQFGADTDLGGIVTENPGGQCIVADITHVNCTEATPMPVSFTITGASSWIAGGLTNGGADGFGVTASYTYAPTGVVPEPSSLMMIGGGLVGLGLVARRKRKV